MSRFFFIFSAIWFLALGTYLGFFARIAKSGFNDVPERERPAWSYMPLWFYRILGVVCFGSAAALLYLYVRRTWQ